MNNLMDSQKLQNQLPILLSKLLERVSLIFFWFSSTALGSIVVVVVVVVDSDVEFPSKQKYIYII